MFILFLLTGNLECIFALASWLHSATVAVQKIPCVVTPKYNLESIADRRADMLANQEEDTHSSTEKDTHKLSNDRLLGVPVEYARTLEKAYRFYKDGYVQQVKYHPMPMQNDHICINAKVLPSMKKNQMYKIVIVICETSIKVSTAYCSCPAGLAGYCNHISASVPPIIGSVSNRCRYLLF